MADQPRMGPELAGAVERARKAARETGELLPSPTSVHASPFTAEARQVVDEWHRSGEFDRAVAALGMDDPDLATQ